MAYRVALVSQKNYDAPGLEASMRRAVDLSGFDLSSACGKRVLLKPNMLGAYPPSMGVTTEPAFVATAARIFQSAGAEVSIGDSPNWMHPADRVWEITGMREAARLCGARELGFEQSGSVKIGGVMIAKAAAEADIVVNLPKFKTHGLTVLTLAVKNLFGCVCGMQKSTHHRDAGDRKKFAEIVVRIAEAVNPALTILDGIIAMEGDGPSGGTLKNMGVLAAGTNIHAVDETCCRLINFLPLELDTLATAKTLGFYDDSKPAELVGDPIDLLSPKDFTLPATYTKGSRDWWISRFVMDRIWRAAWAKPVIDPKACKRCLLCVKGCPVSAILQPTEGDAPHVDQGKCIECFCCHELCPHRAIELKRSRAVSIVSWLIGLQTRSHLAGKGKETE